MANDTLPEAHEARRQALASLSSADRLREALRLSDFVRELARQGHEDRARRSQESHPKQ